MGLLAGLVLLMAALAGAESGDPTPLFRSIAGERYMRTGHVAPEELRALRAEAADMFNKTYGSYMDRAFPLDELRPLTCRGENTFGGIALTLVDSLDTLLVVGMRAEFESAVRWISENLTYDRDQRVSVFEVTIRAVGSLVSAHSLAELDPTLVPGYDGGLLRLALDLGRRLLPAFETESGVPLAWVNLRTGTIPGDTRNTCTAGAGTLLLEFGMLSRLSGERVFWDKARAAMVTLYQQRSKLDLLGNTINADTLQWLRQEAGIGAGIDSYYEYLLKGYLMFGDKEMLSMFAATYAAAMTHMRQGSSKWSWLVDVRMDTGKLAKPWVSSLGAFWPGMQAMVGQVEEAAQLHSDLFVAWKNFGGLPEMFDLSANKRHPTERGYPLRPELIESTFVLHAATKEPYLLEVGRELQATIQEHHAAPCGYAGCKDVQTRTLEDSTETFFLAETTKYLYLLHSNTSSLLHHYILTTEGHLLPPLPDDFGAHGGKVELRELLRGGGGGAVGAGGGGGGGGTTGGGGEGGARGGAATADPAAAADAGPCEDMSQYCGYWAGIKECDKNPRYMRRHCRRSCGLCPAARPAEVPSSGGSGGNVSALDEDVRGEVARSSCRSLCEEGARPPWEAEEASAEAMGEHFPLLPPMPGAPALLARRRCIACINVARALAAAQEKRARSLLVTTRRHQDHHAKKVVCQDVECRAGACVCKDGGHEVAVDAAPRIPESTRERVEAALARAAVSPSSRLPHKQQRPPVTARAAGVVRVGSAAQAQAEAQAGGGAGTCAADAGGGGAGSGLQRGKPVLRVLCIYRVVGIKIYCDSLEELPLKMGAEADAQLAGLGENALVIQVSEDAEERAGGVLRLEQGGAAVQEALRHLGYGDVDCPGSEGPTTCRPRRGAEPGDTLRGLVLSESWAEVELMPGAFGDRGWPEGPDNAPPRPVVWAAPADACSPLSNAAEAKGAIVLAERGGCTFVSKAVLAELAGGSAIVVVNTQGDGQGGLVLMGDDGSGVAPRIPAALARRAEGSLLRRLLREGEIGGRVGGLSGRLYAPAEPREVEAGEDPRPSLPPAGPELARWLQGRTELLFSPQGHQRLLSLDLGGLDVGGLLQNVNQWLMARAEAGPVEGAGATLPWEQASGGGGECEGKP